MKATFTITWFALATLSLVQASKYSVTIALSACEGPCHFQDDSAYADYKNLLLAKYPSTTIERISSDGTYIDELWAPPTDADCIFIGQLCIEYGSIL